MDEVQQTSEDNDEIRKYQDEWKVCKKSRQEVKDEAADMKARQAYLGEPRGKQVKYTHGIHDTIGHLTSTGKAIDEEILTVIKQGPEIPTYRYAKKRRLQTGLATRQKPASKQASVASLKDLTTKSMFQVACSESLIIHESVSCDRQYGRLSTAYEPPRTPLGAGS